MIVTVACVTAATVKKYREGGSDMNTNDKQKGDIVHTTCTI